MVPTDTPAPVARGEGQTPAPFHLTLANFEGPFDLLLTLISRRKLDISDIALAQVTDEFLAYINRAFETGADRALDEASDFIVTAATLLELKSARLLPQGIEGLSSSRPELLEARDLLFARLLQYRAYRQVAAFFEDKLAQEAQRFARSQPLDPALAQLLPPLVFETSPQDLAQLAASLLSRAQATKAEDPESQEIRLPAAPQISLQEQETYLLEQLATQGLGQSLTFDQLNSDSPGLEVILVRFLALLELYKQGRISLRQDQAFGPISLGLLAPEAEEVQA